MRATSVALLAAPLVGTAIQIAPWLSGTGAGRRLFPAITHVPSTDAVALTFDDGPDHQLERFLDVLGEAGARATFFLVGEQVKRHPTAPRAILAAGHEIAVHGLTHVSHLRRTPADLSEDLRKARLIIEDAAGEAAPLYRPPYGVFSFGSWRECTRQGWERVLWSRWGKDWDEAATPQGIADCIGQPAAADILLLHDSDRYSSPNSWRNTLGALPIVLDRIKSAGLVSRPVGELLGRPSQKSALPPAWSAV